MSSFGLQSVTCNYGRIRALDAVTLDFDHGTTVLLGRNGAGKSTLCRILAGVERPGAGHVTRDGCAVGSFKSSQIHRAATGWLPQSFAVPRFMTVESYVRYAGWLKGMGGHQLTHQVGKTLASVGLEDLAKNRLGALSGGMVRRVGIAGCLVAAPELVVLDEPSVGLDPEQRHSFHELIRGFAGQRTVVVSTHLIEDALALADRVVVLDRGDVIFSGEMSELQGSGDGDAATQVRSAFMQLIGDRNAIDSK